MKNFLVTREEENCRLIAKQKFVRLAANSTNNQAKSKLQVLFDILFNARPGIIFFLFILVVSGNDIVAQESTGQTFGQLFVGSPWNKDGEGGCNATGGSYNGHWKSYFTYDSTSITLTAGNDCRTVNTATCNCCIFDVGDSAITQISFDFEISDSCHTSEETDWLAFWMYSNPWTGTAEVDFIESKYGPGSGLNSNFDGNGRQVVIFESTDTVKWKGSIVANFSGSGNSVTVSVSNSVNSNIATSTLSRDSGYFFVLDTSPTTASGCTVTISNVMAKGKISRENYPENCDGLKIN